MYDTIIFRNTNKLNHLGSRTLNHPALNTASTIAAEKNTRELNKLITTSQNVLLKIQAVFPFDFFPDQISIEPTQINFTKKSFFATYHMQSIPIKNVADVFLETSLVFASLKIIDSSYIENSVQVDYLKKDDACQARRIIQGLVLAMKNNVGLSNIEPDRLAAMIERLGEAQSIDLRHSEEMKKDMQENLQ